MNLQTEKERRSNIDSSAVHIFLIDIQSGSLIYIESF